MHSANSLNLGFSYSYQGQLFPKEEIKCVLLRLFELNLEDFNIADIIKSKREQLAEKEDTIDDTDEEVKTTDISNKI